MTIEPGNLLYLMELSVHKLGCASWSLALSQPAEGAWAKEGVSDPPPGGGLCGRVSKGIFWKMESRGGEWLTNVVLVVVRDPGVEQEDEEQDEHLNKHGARVEVHARFLVVEAPDFLEKAVFVFGEKELRLVFDVLLELVPNQIE